MGEYHDLPHRNTRHFWRTHLIKKIVKPDIVEFGKLPSNNYMQL
jgi:hypothetical protein